MKAWKENTWQFETSGLDGKCQLFGVNIFDHKWSSTGRSVIVRDPAYNQEHSFEIFHVAIDGEEREFAAGEFSNMVWGFYVFKY